MPNDFWFKNSRTCSHNCDAPAPRKSDKPIDPQSLYLKNLSFVQALNLDNGSWDSNDSKISITGVALTANRKLMKIKAKANNDVAPTKEALVNRIFSHTEFKLTESNHR